MAASLSRLYVEIRLGERVLIQGASGSGKSTLFRAIAGLWPWGSGLILTPDPETMMFLPQRPYLPLGTLRAAVCHPAAAGRFDEASVCGALDRCALGKFADERDREDRWDRTLSLGQQQRVAFARLLLHRPSWVFMDEATSALDEGSQAAVLSLFEGELAHASVLAIGHRPGLEAFHTRMLHISQTEAGAAHLLPDPDHPSPSSLYRTSAAGRFGRDAEQAEVLPPRRPLAESLGRGMGLTG